MTLTLELPVETEKQLLAKVTAKGLTIKSYVEDLLKTDIAASAADDSKSLAKLAVYASAEDWIAEHRALATRHLHIVHSIDDNRERIYAGRGE